MRITCDAKCSKCYFKGGRTSEFNMNDKIFFCPNCKRKYFCDIGLGRSYDHFNNPIFTCPFCTSRLISEEVDKIIIARDIKVQSTDGGRTVTKLEKSQISELCDIKGLTIDVVKEFSIKYFDIPLYDNHKKITDVYEALMKVASYDDETIGHFYNALFRSDYSKRELLLRFVVYYKETSTENLKIVLGINNLEKCDLKFIDANDKEIWVFVSDKDMDLKGLEEFANKVFGIDFKNHPEIVEVFIISKSFSFMAKQLIVKFHKAITAIDEVSEVTDELSRSLKLTLWEAELNSLKFRRLG